MTKQPTVTLQLLNSEGHPVGEPVEVNAKTAKLLRNDPLYQVIAKAPEMPAEVKAAKGGKQ